ncbi:MAG TPA: sugar ABC transporter ATP-binding protein [Pseudonocardia sp.]|jgi:simple sugar transport system ATP-binding protein|nr:sugar ABC transporter ATP-binding protein [Pseudonocardia sp.]
MTDTVDVASNAWEPPPDGVPVLALRGATKAYRGVYAIKDIDFDIHPGEVHALVGENGAGKSTICKIISGAVSLDDGTMELDGRPARFREPHDALGAGIAMVYQETSLVPTMTVAQNLDLGHEPLLTRLRTINISSQQLLQSMNFDVDPTAQVYTLGGAKKQMVEIARAIKVDAKLIIFDEPTAALAPEDIMHLFDTIRALTEQGRSVIFVSHALEEALAIADRVTVMRDGRRRLTERAANLTRDDLVRHMVGRDITKAEYNANSAGGGMAADRREVLSVQNLTMGNVVKNMSFSAYAGEVLGIFGLVGSGRTETAKLVVGALKRNRINGGRVELNGHAVRYRVPRQAVRDGICYITEDRKANGFFETMGISENIYLGTIARRRNWWPFVRRGESRRVAEKWIERLSIRAINPDAKVIELSGGNQQKVTIAKSLAQEPDVLIFDEPTRGIDIGAIEEIHQIVRDLAREGKAVIVISSYLPEILTLSDRILVARQGRIAAEFSQADATEEKIMYASIF